MARLSRDRALGAAAFLLVLCLALARPAAAQGRARSSFEPGHEEAVLGLLAPDDVETFRCLTWGVNDVHVGPECAVRFQLVDTRAADRSADDARLTAVLRPIEGTSPAGRSIAVTLERDGSTDDDHPLLFDCLRKRIARNDPGDFFASRCTVTRAPVSAAPFPWWALLRALVFVAAAVFALLLLGTASPGGDRRGLRLFRLDRGLPPPGARPGTPTGRLSRREWLALGVLTALALALRARAMAALGPGPFEMESFGTGTPFHELLWQTSLSSGSACQVGLCYHPPLLRVALDLWLPVGDLFGVGGELLWLRLPNLALTALLLWLLVRAGRLAGAPAAGWAAAALAALLPRLVELSAFQGPYFAELVLTTWFLERLAAHQFGRGDDHRSLALAAAAAVWTGHLSWLVVGPGLLVFLATAWRRGERRRGLAAALLFGALYGPIAGSALDATITYATVSVAHAPGALEAATMRAVHGHQPILVPDRTVLAAVTFPGRLAALLLGLAGAVAALVGFLALLVRRPRAAWFPLLALVLYAAASVALATRWVNFSPLFPLLLFAPAWGLAALPRRVSRVPLAAPAAALFAVVALTAGGLRAYQESPFPDAAAIAGWLLGGEDVTTAAATLQTVETRDAPVLVLAIASDTWYLLCPARDTVAAYHGCERSFSEARWDPHVALLRFTPGHRPLAAYSRHHATDLWERPGCPPLQRLAGRPPWSEGPWFALIGPEFRATASPDCAQRLLDSGCEVRYDWPEARLLRCPPLAPGDGRDRVRTP